MTKILLRFLGITLVTQPRLQLTPNQTELFVDSKNVIKKFLHHHYPVGEKKNVVWASRAALTSGPKKIPDVKAKM